MTDPADGVSKPGDLALFEETKETLHTRVARLATGLAWSEVPPSRTRHLVTNVQVEPSETESEVRVRSNFLVYRNAARAQSGLVRRYARRCVAESQRQVEDRPTNHPSGPGGPVVREFECFFLARNGVRSRMRKLRRTPDAHAQRVLRRDTPAGEKMIWRRPRPDQVL